ncbi:MAG: Type II secretion system protein [Methanomicrobiales archaeon 53_19]|jgi:flagellar protein FlaJ|uniref:type II secretion system F family protein n=1 Tax=Methanocalculus sp. TaxID=2004547 RepID=UPI000749E4C2|nr:type II secretion system F family protein [Methanocalculus sp.]KUK70990.1 MAG: Type II secretion system protein [Methanocalculus sp. 52_23]KUL04872.1 MAG: Type II secretion system protein [Methanomicrobiales archaeon 53_19]HIJ06120.1 secretion system protein [Methanocalculus sp.]
MNRYELLCFNLLGERMRKKKEKYLELHGSLISARHTIPFETYLATATITSVIAGVLAAVVTGILSYIFQIPHMITYSGSLPVVVYEYADLLLIAGTLMLTFLSLFIVGGMTYLLFLMYPPIMAGERRRKIDASLPHAINYITAMSTAGITPAEIFRLLGESPVYGESAAEARYIAREIDVFGRDLIDALRVVSTITPSDRLKEFLQGAMGAISSGSNLTEYFKLKANQYAIENRQQQKAFLETLGLISESYVTALVAGTLFLVILQSVMSMLSGGGDPIFLYVIIYLIMPFGSAMFLVMIDSMTPEV